MNLSRNEFEVLQAVVRSNGVKLPQLYSRVNIPETAVDQAIIRLIRKRLIRRIQELIIAKPGAVSALQPYKVKRAVILAAGMGTRMRPVTETVPKPMALIHEKRIIETQLDALLAAGITDITIVRGYLGEAFDVLLSNYPTIRFMDNPRWNSTGAIVSTELAIDLLAGAYLLEGDLFIKNPDIIRTYEYHSSYCGIPGDVTSDWHFYTDSNRLIKHLTFGDSQAIHGQPHRFVGIMYWTHQHAQQLKKDLRKIMQNSANHQRFIESVPFDSQTDSYDIFVRHLQAGEVIEVDTYKELQLLRQKEMKSL